MESRHATTHTLHTRLYHVAGPGSEAGDGARGGATRDDDAAGGGAANRAQRQLVVVPGTATGRPDHDVGCGGAERCAGHTRGTAQVGEQ